MPEISHSPIGLFDSGIGGLSVARALSTRLPNENIIYVGDTANMPYGDKSSETLCQYAHDICYFLQDKGCKLIAIACHSATTAAAAALETTMTLPVFDIISPTIKYLRKHHAHQRVGLIGTKRTIQSRLYEHHLQDSDIDLCTLETPLLAPMVETHFHTQQIDEDMIAHYLSNSALANIDALILGSTHYSLIKEHITAYYPKNFTIIDPAEILTTTMQHYLETHSWLNHATGHTHQFYASLPTKSFVNTTQQLFNAPVELYHQSTILL